MPKILVSPQSFQNCPPIQQITQNLPTISRFKQREMETSNITANCAKFAQFANDNGERCEIRMIIANFSQSLLHKRTSTSDSKSRSIRSIREYSERLTRN